MTRANSDGGRSAVRDLLEAFELHSPAGIREALQAGASPIQPVRGKTPVDWLIEMYTRSNRFADCLMVLLESGAVIADPLLQAILLDDGAAIRNLTTGPAVSERVFSLECAYTSLHGVSALHVCAEYNSVKCARAMLDAGMDVNIRAATDGHGLGGQTPLFHTVNSNGNHCRPIMELLVDAGAALDVRAGALAWGAGFDWETIVFDVTPLSYAQCGLYSQFHRREEQVYSNISYLYEKRYGTTAPVRNVPNKYLDDPRVFPPRT